MNSSLHVLSRNALGAISQSEIEVRDRLIHGARVAQFFSYGMVGLSMIFAGFFYLDARHQRKIADEKSTLLERSRAGYKAKSEFISTINHELRTPLTTMSGSLALLKMPQVKDDPSKVQHLLDLSISGCDRLGVLVNRLLDLESYENGRFKLDLDNIVFDEVLQNAIEECYEASEFRDISIVNESLNEPIPIIGDGDRLQLAFKEVLENAIRFSDESSSIVITAEKDDSSLLLSITDHGVGIPEDMLEKVFERFSQVDSSDKRKYGGVGNGLFIAKAIVEAHGGEIWLSSTFDVGTSAWIRIPRDLGAEVQAAA